MDLNNSWQNSNSKVSVTIFFLSPTTIAKIYLLFLLLVSDINQELGSEITNVKLPVNRNMNLKSLGVNITNINTTFMVKQNVFTLSIRIQANIKLFLLCVWAKWLDDKVIQVARCLTNLLFNKIETRIRQL